MYVKIGDEIAFHPGECLEEFIESGGMTPYQLASKIGMDVDYVQGLIDGSQSVTKEFAKAMADCYEFANDGRFWLNLQETFNKKVGDRDV